MKRIYSRHHIIANAGYLGVDFFLLLSGFVVSLNHNNKPIQSSFRYAWLRVKKIYPDFLFAVILMLGLWTILDNRDGIAGIASHLWSTKYQYLLANALVPTELEMRSIWFLSFWLIGIIVLAATLKRGYVKLMGILSLSFMSWHAFTYGSLYGTPDSHNFLWSPLLLKCVSEVIIGALVYNIYAHLKDVKLSKNGRLLLSVIEILTIAFVIYAMAREGRGMIDYDIFIAFIIVIVLSFAKKTYLSKLLDNRMSLFLGKMSLPIYVYHLCVIKIASFYWLENGNKLIMYTLVGVGVLVFSYLCHLLVERLMRPGLEYCGKKLVEKRL